MPSAQVIDVERLLEPVSDDTPQGSDIREDRSPTSDYYTIKDARNQARATERSGLFDPEIRAEALNQWKPVLEKGEEILANTSKDLEVASWMIEASVRLHGFTGLRDGLSVLRGLVENFWEGLYPEIDEDGIETKVAPITGLNGDGADGTLLAPIRNCPVTAEGSQGEFSFFEYQQIYDASKITDEEKKAERYETLGSSLEDVEKTIASTDEQFYLDLVEDIEICNEEYKKLNDLLYEHCSHDAPPSSQITGLLDEIQRSTRFLFQDILARAEARNTVAETPEASAEPEEGDDSRVVTQTIASSSNAVIMSGPITNREQALDQLKDVAEYFRTYEPHTPLADGIERLVRWGRMTVAELMMELMPEETSRSIFSQLTGVAMDGTSTATYVAPPAPAAAPQAAPQETAAAPAEETPAQEGGWGDKAESQPSESGW